jgi:transcriptional regulator with XRE-family HTH domain
MDYEKSIEINKNQFLAVQMLAAGKSGKAVAEALNVAPETISRWQQLPQFKSHLNATLWELKRATGKRLVGLIATAVDAITDAFNDPKMSTHDRFIMGIKFLELCGKHNIEIKTRID